MAKRSHAFELNLVTARAPTAAREALESLGWEVLEEDGGHLTGEEEAAGLCCVVWPVKADITWATTSDNQTRFELDCSIAGWGPIQTRQLIDRINRIQRRIRQQA